jgi:hypothetical protein
MVIKRIIQQSIKETLEKFKPFENANQLKGFNMGNEKDLIDFLNTKLIDYKETINYYDRHYKVSTEQGSKKLVKELEKLEKAKQSFQFEDATILNDINQYKDVITNTMKDYCLYAFLYNATEAYFNQVTQSDEKPHIPEIVKSDGTKFSLKEIAYLYYYNGDQITKENCDTEVKKYGWSSGHKLRLEYNTVKRKRLITDRLNDKKLENKIEDIKSIIDYLKLEKRMKPKDELNKLETDLEVKRGY